MKRVLVLCALFAQPAVAAEQYIIPILASAIPGSPYRSTLSLTNTTSASITAHISSVYPLETLECTRLLPCGANSDVTVRPHSTLVLSDGGGPGLYVMSADRLLKLGAIVVESDSALIVESEAFRPTPSDRGWKSVEVARSWLNGESFVPRVLGFSSANLFLVNPNATPLTVDYWSDYGGSGQFTLAASASAFVPLAQNFYCPRVCGGAETPIGWALPLHLRANAPYLASVSVQSNEMPPVVRLARPAE